MEKRDGKTSAVIRSYKESRFSKGQTSPEFVIIVAALLFILVVMLIAYKGFDEQTGIMKKRLDAERVARSLADAINFVEEGGNGTEYVYLNNGNDEFGVTIAGRVVIVNSSDAYASMPILTNATNASLIGMNEYVRVRNVDGVVYVEPA